MTTQDNYDIFEKAIDERDALKGEVKRLRAENARLRAVAEAARVLNYHGRSNECVMVNKDKWNALRQALAALDALGQGE